MNADPTTKTRILRAIERIENRLEQFKHIPEEVAQLRALNDQLHAALKQRQNWDVWKVAAIRSLKQFISMIDRST